MAWAARIGGIIHGVFGLLGSMYGLGYLPKLGPPHWRYLLLGLLPILMVAIAWRWPGRWPEPTVGVAFIVWGLALLPASWTFITTLPNPFSVFQVLVVVCLPIAIGILFILAYRMTHSVKR